MRLIPLADLTGSALRFDPVRWPGRVATLATAEGLHYVVTAPHGLEYRLLLPGPRPPAAGAPLGFAVDARPLGFQRRVAVAQRFLDFALGADAASADAKRVIAPEEAIRRAHVVWAIDLQIDGASEHQVGAQLFDLDVAGATWSNHPDRSETRRLLALGRAYVGGGYRRLLR